MQEHPVVFIKELSEQDRPFMLNHFLDLSAADRRLRFGAVLPDEVVARYVQSIDFTRDTVFGVYESTYSLAGVGFRECPSGTGRERVASLDYALNGRIRHAVSWFRKLVRQETTK